MLLPVRAAAAQQQAQPVAVELVTPRPTNRPWRALSTGSLVFVVVLEAVDVDLEADDDALVAGDLGGPAAGVGVVPEGAHVVELVAQRGQGRRGGDEVVALLADVCVGQASAATCREQ